MSKPRVGDLFAIPLLGNDWVTGRILLDVKQLIAKKLIADGSALMNRRSSLLVEIYSELSTEPSAHVSKVLIPGEWTSADRIIGREKPVWPIVGHATVNPSEVDFPETVSAVQMKTTFRKGEISLTVPAPRTEIGRWGCDAGAVTPPRLIRACEFYLGRKHNLGAKPELFSLEHEDLRFSPHRDEVYRLMGEDPKRTYFEWATSLGLKPERLWA